MTAREHETTFEDPHAGHSFDAEAASNATRVLLERDRVLIDSLAQKVADLRSRLVIVEADRDRAISAAKEASAAAARAAPQHAEVAREFDAQLEVIVLRAEMLVESIIREYVSHSRPPRNRERLRESLRSRFRFVDEEWYLETYADVALAGMSGRDHFLSYGAKEGRQPADMGAVPQPEGDMHA